MITAFKNAINGVAPTDVISIETAKPTFNIFLFGGLIIAAIYLSKIKIKLC